jgi:hypothetical protein
MTGTWLALGARLPENYISLLLDVSQSVEFALLLFLSYLMAQ